MEFGIAFHIFPLNEKNYLPVLREFLRSGDLLINTSVDVSSLALIQWCQANDVLYLDTCIEPWAGGYDDSRNPIEHTTNYWLREQVLTHRSKGRATAVIAHGANPGMVSHFVKQGLLELAEFKGVRITESFAELAMTLGIRTIQVAERDTQHDGKPLSAGEFANTWSVDGLLSEAFQHAELGWGSHERALPAYANQYEFGCRSGIYLNARSANVKVKSWVPSSGEQSAYLITHHEALSISSFLTVRGYRECVMYRPTVFYAYHPTERTCSSLDRWVASGFKPPLHKTLIRDDVQSGYDELGVLLVFDGGAYWYGSTLTYAHAAKLAPHNNATSLQVASAMIGALEWMFKHPWEGVVEAEDIPHDAVLSVAIPYLGHVRGALTTWQPAGAGQLQFADFLEKSCSL